MKREVRNTAQKVAALAIAACVATPSHAMGEFDRALTDPSGINRYGAIHASDIEYAFNTLDSKKADWQPEDRQAALTTATAFANFVKTGNPNGTGVPEWPVYDAKRLVMHLDAVSKVAPEANRARYEFLDSVSGK